MVSTMTAQRQHQLNRMWLAEDTQHMPLKRGIANRLTCIARHAYQTRNASLQGH